MRLVKLSTAEFNDIDEVDEFFDEDLPQREPPGKFLFPAGWIAADGLDESELLLFSFLGQVVRIARAGSGRLQNTDSDQDRYPHYFVVDMTSVRKVDFSVIDLEEAMRNECGVTKSIAVSHGWVLLPNTEAAERIIQRLGGLKRRM